MGVLVPIVEGFGEVEAVPILLRRLLEMRGRWDLQIARPKNAHGCGNLTKVGGLEKFIELAFRERNCAGVLVLMDADSSDACPVQMAYDFADRIIRTGARHPVAIVFARREYEAWFLASIETLVSRETDRRVGLPNNLVFEGNVEEVRDAKGWLSRHLPSGRIYKETEDQASMTDRIDIELVTTRSRSFRRLRRAIDDLIGAIDGNRIVVTPECVA